MLRQIYKLLLLPVCLITLAGLVSAQPNNLLRNPNAQEGARYWQAQGKAAIDESTGSFLVRDGGFFYQEIVLPEGSAGQYVVLSGSAASEHVNADGATMGLPLLYGYMMTPVAPGGGGRIYAYLQGQQMLSRSRTENEWVKLWGVFRVPPGAERIQLFLKQDLPQGVALNGSAARFRELGVYLFTTEQEARAFVGSSLTGASARDNDPKDAQNPSVKFSCGLGLDQAPTIDGLQLGMSMEQASRLLPVTEEDRQRSRSTMNTVYARTVGSSSLSVTPSDGNFQSAFGDAKQYSLRFLDGKLYHLHLLLNNAEASDVDELIRRWAGLWNLPPPESWETVEGQGTKNRGKYLLCNGFEVMAYGSPDKKVGYIWMVNTQAEKTARERGAKLNETAGH